jgi:hypothetical protein
MFAAFNAFDSALGLLPGGVRVALYGLVLGVVGMLIYWWTSPQRRIAAVKLEMSEARRALRAYKGTNGREVLRLSVRSLAPALRQLLLVLGPTLLAAAPIVLVVAWLESAYADRTIWSIGPAWMRTWHTPFMVALSVAALVMKFALKIL